MKILWLSTSSGDVWNIHASLDYLGQHEVKRVFYDSKWHEQAAQACATNPGLRDALQAGGWRVLNWPRERVAMDSNILNEAMQFQPDAVIYTSAWEGLFVPLNETLAELNKRYPVIHFLHDGSDYPWWPQLAQFEIDKCFSLTVNIDGGQAWPGGNLWTGERITNGLTLLTPVDPRPYGEEYVPHRQRMYPLCYAGNAGGPIRSYLVQMVGRAIPEMLGRPREESPQTYAAYAGTLRGSRIVINVPYSGSNAAQHVKGRVVEAGFAGTCLLEWKNEATRGWFSPRQEYMEYGSDDGVWESVKDCIETARFLMARPRMTEEIAVAHRERVMREHSPQAFWANVFSRIPTRQAEAAVETIIEAAPEVVVPAPEPEIIPDPAPAPAPEAVAPQAAD